MKKTITLVTSALSLTLAACSGGSSSSGGSSPSVGSDSAIVTNTSAPKVLKTTHPKISLSDLNVEDIARDVVDFAMHTTRSLYYDLEDAALSFSDDITTNLEGGRTDTTVLDCDREGTWEMSYAIGPIGYSGSAGYSLYGPGSTLSVKYNDCGSEYLYAPYLLSGLRSSTVESGFYDGFSAIAENTRIKGQDNNIVVYNGYSYNDDKTKYESYSDGDYQYYYADQNNVQYSGLFLALKDPRSYYFDKDHQLHSFDFFLRKIPGNYSWDGEQYLSSPTPFELDLVNENVRLEIEIIEDLSYDDLSAELIAGKAVVRSASGLLELTFNGDYVDYRLDFDESGDFETTGIIDGASIY